MDLLYLLRSLLRKKWIILLCTITGLAAGYVFFTLRPREYVSLAQYSTGFTMEQKVKINPEENYNLYEIDIRFNNVNVAFASEKVQAMVCYKLLLNDLEDATPFRQLTEKKKKEKAFIIADINKAKKILRDKITSLQLLTSYNKDEKMVIDLLDLYDYTNEELVKHLNLKRVEHTDFINIFANSENPHLSAFMANTAGNQLIRFFNEIYGFRTQSASGKLDSLVATKKRVVDSLTRRFELFKNKVGPTSGEAKATAAMSVVQELYGKYQEETRALNNLKAELNAIDEQIRSLGTEASSTVPVINNNREIMRLQQENNDLEKSKSGKTEEEVKKIKDRIDYNTTRIIQLTPARTGDRTKDADRKNTRRDDLIARKIGLQQQIIASEKNVKQFRDEKDKYEKMTKEDGGDVVVLSAMERDLDLANKEYEGLRSSLQSSLDLDVNPENNFKQTLVGLPADKPNPSRRWIMAGLAGFLMLFFSGFIILLLEFLDNSYKTPTIFQRSAKVKLLASLNSIDLKNKNLQGYLQHDGSETISAGHQLFFENLRKLRYELENSGKKVFLVTSTRAKEGKSVIIESIANSFSLSHKRVLIIDANFSHNSLSEKFGAKPSLEAFSSNGNPKPMEKIASVTGETTIPNTHIIGCGEGDYTPSEILPRSNLFESIDKLAAEYDFIFIEAASLNHHPDAKELIKYADGIIAVFSATSDSGQNDKESIEYLKSTGNKFVGAVFNNVQKVNMDL